MVFILSRSNRLPEILKLYREVAEAEEGTTVKEFCDTLTKKFKISDAMARTYYYKAKKEYEKEQGLEPNETLNATAKAPVREKRSPRRK
jgi:hypothetical protein